MNKKLYKKIVLFPYNPDWAKMYDVEAEDLRRFLGPHCLGLHHMGSTSIPRLSAKQDLDIMCIVDDLKASLVLQGHGFTYKGEGNIPLRYFFSKNTERSKVNLHVIEPDHGFIPWNLAFRDYMRTHEDARNAYQALKREIVQNESSGERVQNMMPRYTLEKGQFIIDTIEKAGFEDFTINFCFHNSEWESYHRIRREQIFVPAGKPYVLDDPIYSADNHFHFVLYKGTKVVAVAHVEAVNGSEALVRELAVDTPHQGKGYDLRLIEIIEKWARIKDLGPLS